MLPTSVYTDRCRAARNPIARVAARRTARRCRAVALRRVKSRPFVAMWRRPRRLRTAMTTATAATPVTSRPSDEARGRLGGHRDLDVSDVHPAPGGAPDASARIASTLRKPEPPTGIRTLAVVCDGMSGRW
jgi:hypothetical protein